MFRRPSCLILLRLSRFFAVYTTDIQVFKFECTVDKSQVLVKPQKLERFVCLSDYKEKTVMKFLISLLTLMSLARAC